MIPGSQLIWDTALADIATSPMQLHFDQNVCAASVQPGGLCGASQPNAFCWEGYPAEPPVLPALPRTLAETELLLHSPVVNLAAITEVARCDAGLIAQLLLLANRDQEESDRFYRIEDCVVKIGLSPLRELVGAMPSLLPCDWRYGALLNHSRLTALAAEAIASQMHGVNPEQAYLSGLLHLFPDLVSVAWAAQTGGEASSESTAWPLPAFAWEVIRSFRHPSAVAGQEHRLVEVAFAACEWASQTEQRWSATRRSSLICI